MRKIYVARLDKVEIRRIESFLVIEKMVYPPLLTVLGGQSGIFARDLHGERAFLRNARETPAR